jgi:hypothetical protein
MLAVVAVATMSATMTTTTVARPAMNSHLSRDGILVVVAEGGGEGEGKAGAASSTTGDGLVSSGAR